MDSITQAVLGASVGEAVLGNKIGNKASILGAIIATIPDLDILLLPFIDEIQKISMHRGYSHSILFCIVIALLLAFALQNIKWTRGIPIIKLWVFSFLALLTHILLDAFTTYGTQLFLPFNDKRVSFDSINIVDPVYTVPLLFGVLFTVISRNNSTIKTRPYNTLGLILSSVYLIFTLANKQYIEQVFYSQIKEQSISSQSLLTVPVKIGNLVWYGVAKDNTHLHIGKYSILEKNKIEFHSFPINENLLDGLDDNLVDRMKWFSQGYYTVAEKDGKIRIYNMQCDMQGIREFGAYKAPTAFYFEITPLENKNYELLSGMHPLKE